VRKLPQILINVPVTDRLAVAASDTVAEAVNAVEDELGETGRVLLRPSGTEQLVRVMVEAPTPDEADAVCRRLVGVVEEGSVRV
jgi:phosphoglucosamine mutase